MSPKMTEVLLCSAPTTIDGPPGGSSVDGGLAVEREAGAGASVGDALEPQCRCASLSCSASYRHRRAAVGVDLLADEGVREVLRRARVGRQRQLVGLGLAVVVGDRDEVDAHGVQPGARSPPTVAHVGDRPGAALAGEPALVAQVTGQSSRSAVELGRTSALSFRRGQPEPVEAVAREGEQVGQLADRRGSARRRSARPGGSPRSARRSSSVGCGEAGEVVDAQHDVVPELADEGQHAPGWSRRRSV